MFSKYFRKYLYKYSLFFLVGILILVIIDYVQLDVPKIIGNIISLLSDHDKDINPDNEVYNFFLREEIIDLVIVVLVVTVGRFLWRLVLFGTSRKIEYELRNDMFFHASTLGQDYYSEQKVGGMMTYFINDLSAVRMAYGPGIMMLVDTIFLGSFTFYKMLKLNKDLTLILIIPIIGLMIAMVLINFSMRKNFRTRQEKFRDLSDYTQENFSGITVIKAYIREAFEIMTFKNRSEELYKHNIKFFKKAVWLDVIISVAINIIVVVVIGFGAYSVVKTINLPKEQQFNIGQLTEYLGLFMMLAWPTRALGRVLSIYSQAGASADRINDFLNIKPTVYDNEDVLDVDNIIPSLEFKNLTFTYPDDPKTIILDDISFKINEGEMVGILGKTGSGKTTIVDLLLRVYNVENNSLFLGGYDIMNLKLKKVREIIGYVPQDNFLFSETIKENIAFSNSELTDDEIVEASKLSDIYSNVLEFKEGFNTILGERGVTVSGGQKQRISIARAIAKDPDILILDDSVSAVDTKTEETIIENLHNIRKGKTTIFVAHRISTVKNMNKIIILDKGKVIGIGSHDELLKNNSFYQDIVRRQQLEEMIEGGDSNE